MSWRDALRAVAVIALVLPTMGGNCGGDHGGVMPGRPWPEVAVEGTRLTVKTGLALRWPRDGLPGVAVRG